jgi:glycosyltransferase involved in cell wall biosynthesis
MISVCIPVFNGARLIDRALRSFEAQTMAPGEVLVVDDGSTDETPSLLERWQAQGRLRFVRQANGGLPCARNTGARHMRGTWMVPLDADDELDPRALELAHAAVARTPDAGWCVTDIARIGNDGEEEVFTTQLPPGPTRAWLPALLERNFIERTILLRRDMLLSLGGYDEAFRIYEDWELNIRMVQAGVVVAYAPGPLYRYIKTEGGITDNVPRMLAGFARLYARHHRPLADTGDPVLRHIYARRMWALGRDYAARLRDPVTAARFALTSLRYDLDPKRLARAVGGRLLGRSG